MGSRLAAAVFALGCMAGCGPSRDRDAGPEPATGSAQRPDPEPDDGDPTVAPKPEEADPSLDPVDPGPRTAVSVDVHRTVGGPGMSFWILAEIENPTADPLADLRATITFADEAAQARAVATTVLDLELAPSERRAVAILVDDPEPHEQLDVEVTGTVATAPIEPASMVEGATLEHDPVERAELGGWVVRGRVRNEGTVALTGVVLEVQGLDGDARLLGIDWLELSAIDPGGAQPFELGGLRYEVHPEDFRVALLRRHE